MTQPPEPQESTSFSAQLTDLVLKIIKPGGVTIGGISGFWFLLVQSDIPKAIASAVIGLGVSYGAKLLQPIHAGNERRLESAGKAIDKTIDKSTRFVLDKMSGGTIEDRYLHAQAMDCQRLRSEGVAQHSGIFVPLLEEVFVPLSLGVGASLPGFKVSVDPIADQDVIFGRSLSIWDVLAKAPKQANFRQLVILAWGGYGKTTLLKHIAYIYGTRQQQRRYNLPKRIPILLALRKYRDLLAQESPPSLPELIAARHIPDLPEAAELQVSPQWTKQILKAGEAIVMLDGFDEVAKGQRPAVARWINQQMHQYSKSVFIVTSRPRAYTEQPTNDRLELATPLWVQDFNAKQRKYFVERWYLCQERYASGGDDTPDVRQTAMRSATELLEQIEARQELKVLAKNPLLLNMIVTFHRRYPGADLPKRRVELYREICLLQLRDRPSARRLDTLLTECDAQVILQILALTMMRNRLERIERSQLLQELNQILQQQGETIAATDFLEQVVQISELLVERESDEFEFAHLSFQEYFAATQFAQQQEERPLYDYLHDDWWKPTILLYVAQVKNPTSLIREAQQQGAIDFAYACLQETTKSLDPALKAELTALKQTVQTSRYEQLEAYLRAQQWKEADQETYRLMITAIGKEEGQWFEPQELLNFPCDALRSIDQLWVKYSNGRFGFSVQKQIYVDCGAKLDGNYPGEEIWEKFGERVGWRKNGKWLKYSNLSPSFSYPKGNLGNFPMGWLGWLGFWILFSRIETCEV
ncbi:GUN4 domain-containing protein [Leptolyngbya sp. GB1-A1]|uniref:GUN4 domain-containing protein n=1 Tax=Leptolyngbya sp. GB1-A1 TaxID=2933908 RepID=UPI0032974900